MAEEFSVKWGYALDAPGRMAVEKQLEYIAAQGIDMGVYGPVWKDKFAKRTTSPRSVLKARNVLLLAITPKDEVFVADRFCLGLSALDAEWVATEIINREAKLCIDGEYITRDKIPALAAEVGRLQNAYHARASRGAAPKYQQGKRPKVKPVKAEKRPCMYRHYDADDVLLYVGACGNYEKRSYTHKFKSPWVSKIHRVAVEFFGTMKEALVAERNAIWFEKPLHNVRVTMPESCAFLEEAARIAAAADPEAGKRILAMKAEIGGKKPPKPVNKKKTAAERRAEIESMGPKPRGRKAKAEAAAVLMDQRPQAAGAATHN